MMKRTVVHTPSAIAAIKDAIAYRGTMDPINGDTFNAEVRDCAKECLEIVYSDAGEVTTTMTGMGNSSSSSANAGYGGGYGNNSSNGGGGGYGAPMGGSAGLPLPGGSSSKATGMQGIGNPMFADPRLTQSADGTVGGLIGMATQIGGAMVEMIKDPLAKNVPTNPPNGGVGYNPRPDPVSRHYCFFVCVI
jgi:hypothetical protein